MIRKIASVATAAAIAASVLVAAPAHAATAITGEGSGFANGVLNPASSAFNAAQSTYTVTYTKSNSGTGRTKFANSQVDFGATDATYAANGESMPSNSVYVPIVGAPIAIVYYIPGVGNGLKLTPALIGKIFHGDITRWNDAAIAAVNGGVSLPSENINVQCRTNGSGTTYNLSAYLDAKGVSGWNATSDSPGHGCSTNANAGALVTSVHNTAYSIGYADLSDAQNKGLDFARLQNTYKSGSKTKTQWIAPSVASAKKFLEKQGLNTNGSVNLKWGSAKIKGAYTLSAVTYVVASKVNTAEARGVKAFLKYFVKTWSPSHAKALGYWSVSGKFKTKANSRIKLIATK